MRALHGSRVLVDFGRRASPRAIARTLASFGNTLDRASVALAAVSGGTLDLANGAHRRAAIVWLRRWGCRHLRVADTARTSRLLLRWWRRWGDALPAVGVTLSSLGERRLRRAEPAYEDLATSAAARRRDRGREVDVVFGDTAAAKLLYALRPQAFPPWDEPIRASFERGGGGAAYVAYLRDTAAALRELAARLGVPVEQLPAVLGRPASTPAKLIDEYLWVRISRGS